MTFSIEREIVRATEEYFAAAQAQVDAGGPSDIPARCEPAFAAPNVRFIRLKTAPRPWYNEDTSAEDERLDDPRHEPGSNR